MFEDRDKGVLERIIVDSKSNNLVIYRLNL